MINPNDVTISKEKISVILGAFLLAVPIYLLWLWLYAWGQTNGYPANEIFYISHLPVFLNGGHVSELFALGFCAISIIINIRNLRSNKTWIKRFSVIMIMFGGLLAFANLWSMM